MLLSLAKNRMVKTRTNGMGNHCFMYFSCRQKAKPSYSLSPGSFFLGSQKNIIFLLIQAFAC